ncbi:MAG TPA: hypothetical protein VG317_13920 [Pseudonocardiaceae bacterium]|jgi:hypothetical protein|nr:hypothetical protein [Pseudonocardiaceae bacterium]
MTTVVEPESIPLAAIVTMAELASDAEYFQPRLFAIYGVRRGINAVCPEQPFLGWGIDLGDGEGAFFWDQTGRSAHHSDSAEQVLDIYRRVGEAELKWLD